MRYAAGWWAVCLALLASFGESGAQEAAPKFSLKEVTAKLEAAGDARIDIELKAGRALLRSKVVKVTTNKEGIVTALRVQDPDSPKPVSLSLAAIRTITLDREIIYVAAASEKKNGKEALVERELQAAAAEREKWVARARERSVEPWPELSKEEHDAAEEEVRENIKKIKAEFRNLVLYETNEFLFLSDMPREQVLPYAASLDKMYDMMCQMYSIRKGTSVWKGKCLVIAFLQEGDFHKYELMFHRFRSNQAQGVCHNSSDGDVIMACFRGNSPEYLGQVIVHETSHGFIHRYRTGEDLPRWANEGMADHIAKQLIVFPGGVQRKQVTAIEFMRQTGTMQNVLTDMQTDNIHYGMAGLMTEFLIKTDRAKYAAFINGMKEGMPWEESLRQAYNVTPAQLVTAFGKSIGVPNLQP